MSQLPPMLRIILIGGGLLLGWAFLAQVIAHFINGFLNALSKTEDPEHEHLMALWMFIYFLPWLALLILPWVIAKARNKATASLTGTPEQDVTADDVIP